jgi:hypothetical protein
MLGAPGHAIQRYRPDRPEVPAMKNLGLALIVCGLLLVGCNTAPNDPTVAVRAYAPYDNYYGRRGGTPTD